MPTLKQNDLKSLNHQQDKEVIFHKILQQSKTKQNKKWKQNKTKQTQKPQFAMPGRGPEESL